MKSQQRLFLSGKRQKRGTVILQMSVLVPLLMFVMIMILTAAQ